MASGMSWPVYRRLALQGVLTVGLFTAGIHFLGQQDILNGLLSLGGGVAGAYQLRLGSGPLQRGRHSYQQRQWQQAERELTEAIQGGAGSEAYVFRALARCEMGRLSEALMDLEQAMPTDPKARAHIHLAKGVVLYKAKQFEASLTNLNLFLNDYPDDLVACSTRADVYVQLDRPTEALEDYHRVQVQLNSAHDKEWQRRVHTAQACLYASLGQQEEALHRFSALIDLNPTAVNYYNRGVTLFHWPQDYAATIADMDEVIKQDPAYICAYFVRGNAWYELGEVSIALSDYEMAQQLLRQNLDYQPDADDEHGYFASGMARFRLGDYEGSLADLHHAADLSRIHYRNSHLLDQIQNWIQTVETARLTLEPRVD